MLLLLPFSSNQGGSCSSKETDEEYTGDRGSVFMFQPDINENRKSEKEVELEPEVDLELRLFTRPSEFDGDNPSFASSSKKLPFNFHGDEASSCWETGGPWLSLSLSTSQNRSDRLMRAYRPSNSVAASHSSVASNSTIQVGDSSHDVVVYNGGGPKCVHEGCTRAARGSSGYCIRHGGRKRCRLKNCTSSAQGLSGLCMAHEKAKLDLNY